jgi:hypothetical protein
MEEYYRNLTSEPVFMNVHRWKPSGGSAAAAKARYERYLAESEGKYEEGDKSGARLLKRKAEELRKRSLREFGLGPYVLVDRDVAVHYLSLIARRRAEELNADLFAEDFTAAESAIEAIPAVVGHVGTSLMRAYLPKDIGNLPANKIAEFRARTETDRIKFQKAIQSLVNDYSSVSSAEGLERLKRMAVELAREKVEGTRKAYSSIRIETTLKALGTSLAPPALVSWLSSVLHLGLFAPAAIAATLALFGAQMLSDREKMRSDADKDSWSYVLKAARGLKSN